MAKAVMKNKTTTDKLGLGMLTAIVLSTMVGGGIYNIAQTMSQNASLGASLTAWCITGFGILLLVLTFKILNELRPDLNAGIYQYAQQFGGDYLGFNVAWGYWLSVTVAIVAYAVMLNDSMGAFFPVLLEHGWPTEFFGLALIWLMCGLVMCGVRRVAILNTVVTGIKFVILALIITVLVIYAKVGAMKADFWGHALELGSFAGQVRGDVTMSLWCFIGVEGAAMMSSRAKNRSDVGKAGLIGCGLAWILYVLVSALCYGIMSQPELAALPNPSMAYVLRHVCGDWAYYTIIGAVIFSISGSWIAWTLVCAQTPYGAATAKIMPRHFLKVSRHGVPWFALLASTLFMTIFFFIVCLSDSLFMSAVKLTAVMILPAYFFSALYLGKISIDKGEAAMKPGYRAYTRAVALLSILFTLWMLWAGGLSLLLMSSVFYLAGTWFYVQARKHHREGRGGGSIMSRKDRIIFGLLCCAGISTAIMIFTGHSPL